jgi:biopolymer transport protein ExbD
VTIRADQQMTYQHFIRALDIARSSGAEHVNIAHSRD